MPSADTKSSHFPRNVMKGTKTNIIIDTSMSDNHGNHTLPSSYKTV